MIAGLIALLKGDPGVSALVGNNVFRVFLPSGVKPAITLARVGGSGLRTFDGPSMQTVRVRLDYHAATPEAAEQIQIAARNLLEPYAGTLSDGTAVQLIEWIQDLDYYDYEPRQWRVATEFSFYFNL